MARRGALATCLPHRIATGIIRRFDLLAIEDLHLRSMTGSATGTVEKRGTNVAAKPVLHRSTLEQGWGIIRRQLAYKAAWAGKQLVDVDPRRTSQTCSRCGVVDAISRRGKTYSCTSCGFIIDAHFNASRNILQRAVSSPVGTTSGNPPPERLWSSLRTVLPQERRPAQAQDNPARRGHDTGRGGPVVGGGFVKFRARGRVCTEPWKR